MNTQLELLSPPVNFAVVQLPERNFPGVVVQGDTLNGLVRSIEEMGKLLDLKKFEDLASSIEDVREQLAGALGHYEIVCANRGIDLPYPRSLRE